MTSWSYLPTLPVLSDIFSFLQDVRTQDVCHLASTCRTIHDFFKTDRSLYPFWSKIIHRTVHRKYTDVGFMSLMDCYSTNIYSASYFFIEGLDNVRRIMGECQNKSHLSRGKDTILAATTYTEWFQFMKERQCANITN